MKSPNESWISDTSITLVTSQKDPNKAASHGIASDCSYALHARDLAKDNIGTYVVRGDHLGYYMSHQVISDTQSGHGPSSRAGYIAV